MIKLRIALTPAENKEHQRLLAGYQGKAAFDSHFKHFVKKETIIWDDLNVCYSGNLFQMDKCFISADTLHFVDVKKYQGNYCYHQSCWFKETYNLFEQMNRALSITKKMMNDFQVDIQLKDHIIFIDPDAQIILQDEAPIHIVTFNQIQAWLTHLNNQLQPACQPSL